ncbi:MAG: Hsp70 family protein [Muribaculaceae bacterium]
MNWVSIDFGTSYSSATVMIDDKPVKVHPMGGLYNMYGFPTVAYVDDKKNIKVCNEALPWRCQNPERFVKDFKLNIHENELAYLGVTYSEIITEILRTIKGSAEYAIGNDSIEGAVITIPATYADNDPRKQIMLTAAKSAGFVEIEFIKEAEAAAIYYHNIQIAQTGTITLIYDLGGGTFDPALVEHSLDGCRIIGCSSGKECGGKYFEAALYKHFKSKYSFSYNEDETIRIQQIDGIVKLCKDIKEALSSQEYVSFPVPLMAHTTIGYTRSEFENLIKPLLEKTFQECTSLIHSAGKKWNDVSRILLIGGSTAIPCVRTFLRKYLVGQNCSNTPIIQNKSEEGLIVDTLFAVSIGGLLYHCSHKEPDIPVGPTINYYQMALSYKNGNGCDKNWIKAAHFFNEDYKLNGSESSFEQMMEIYQYILDRLELENGNLIFQPIVETVGEDAVDSLVDLLIYLQRDLETKGYEVFIQEIFDVDYWIPITDTILKKFAE